MNKMLYTLGFAFLFLIPELTLLARQPYKVTVIVDEDSGTVTAPNLVDLKRGLSSSSLEDLIPVYTPDSLASFDINLRGILASAAFAANSTVLEVNIPQAGVTETFAGETRDESFALFRDYIRNAGTKHGLLKAYALYSPIDPIAGNPTSLMAQMGQADYLLGRLSPLSGCDCSWSAQPIERQVQGGIYAGRTFAGGFDATTVTIPLRYSYSPDLNRAFIIDAPLTYLRNGGASSIVGSLGVGYRFPILNDWSLTPIFRFGAGGSLDLCTSGTFVSAGVTSAFNYKISDYVLSMTNYAGYMSTTNLWMSGINFNYHLHCYVLKNGFTFTTCDALCIRGKPLNFNIAFTDSFIGRNHLYIRHYDEVGFSLITNYINPYFDYDSLSIGFSFQFGQHHLRGYFLNTTYQF